MTKLVIDADTSWLQPFKRERGDRHLLAMSRGKDALASWLVLRDHGIEVIPYHLYLVPGLEFVDESIAEIEQYFGVKVLQRPHRALIRMLDNLVYQPPWRIDVINAWNPKVPSYIEIENEIRQVSGAPSSAITAMGTKACDSMNRRTTFIRHGHIRQDKDGRETFFPVWNFRKADALGKIERAGLRLPEEYSWFNCSFDGISRRFLEPIKRHRPRDFQKILEWFPLAEIELSREFD